MKESGINKTFNKLSKKLKLTARNSSEIDKYLYKMSKMLLFRNKCGKITPNI